MKKNLSYAFITILLSYCIIGCSEKTTDPETEIRNYIENAKLAAESRNHNDFSDLLHDDYKDQRGMDKSQLTKTIRAYFFTHKNIFLYTDIEDINFLENEQAFVTVNTAMSGKVISNTDSLINLRAKIYRFELLLTKENKQWLLQKAKWKQISVKDLL